MLPSRWLVDEMLGRLARYLRFVGLDVVSPRGASDSELIELAEREERTILTRDRELAERAPRALRILSPWLAEQWREVRREWPDLPQTVRFERCSACNEALVPYHVGEDPSLEGGLPRGLAERGMPVYVCRACRHLYWEGSHTARIRDQLARWRSEASP